MDSGSARANTGSGVNTDPARSTVATDVIAVGGGTVRLEATGFVVGCKTVRTGASAVVTSGETLSLGVSANLVDNGTTIRLPRGTNRGPARVSVPTVTPARSMIDGSAAPASTISARPQSSILNATASDTASITTLVWIDGGILEGVVLGSGRYLNDHDRQNFGQFPRFGMDYRRTNSCFTWRDMVAWGLGRRRRTRWSLFLALLSQGWSPKRGRKLW